RRRAALRKPSPEPRRSRSGASRSLSLEVLLRLRRLEPFGADQGVDQINEEAERYGRGQAVIENHRSLLRSDRNRACTESPRPERRIPPRSSPRRASLVSLAPAAEPRRKAKPSALGHRVFTCGLDRRHGRWPKSACSNKNSSYAEGSRK